jgi:hypothetical protein
MRCSVPCGKLYICMTVGGDLNFHVEMILRVIDLYSFSSKAYFLMQLARSHIYHCCW